MVAAGPCHPPSGSRTHVDLGRRDAGAMRFGISIPNIGDPGRAIEIAAAADANGWDGVFVWDHVHFMRDAAVEVHDPWLLLGAMAVRTSRVRLGALITPLSRRRPWRWAKEIVTLDHLSGGRAVAGVGLGEPVPDDFEMFGEIVDARTRGDRVDEALEIAAALWTGDDVEHHGAHFDVSARLLPTPVQRPRPPVWVGGKWPNRRPLERALRWDGYIPISDEGGPLAPEVIAEITAGVDLPAGFDLVVTAFEDHSLAAYEEAGATWLVVSRWPFDAFLDELGALAAAPPQEAFAP